MRAYLRTRLKALGLAILIAMSLAQTSVAQKITQIKLTEDQVTGLLAAQEDFSPLAGKLAEAAEKPSDELTVQLDAIAKKHGFADFAEYRTVDNNIFLVFEGLDRETGEYVPPADRLELELKEIQNDTTIPDADKKAILAEVNEELAMAESVEHPGNIEMVKKHIDQLSKLLPTPEDPALDRGSGAGQDDIQ